MKWLMRSDNAIDWVLLACVAPLLIFGLVTMSSFTSESYYFYRQVTWVLLSISLLLSFSLIDWRFLRRSEILVSIYSFIIVVLLLLFVVGTISKGAQSWFSFGGMSLQPADFMKLSLVLMLAKYFSKRHIEIANIRHILISGTYAFLPFVAIMLQPDFGSALIIFLIWFGMILVSGVSKKHLFLLGTAAVIFSVIAWMFILQPYQKARIISFLHPLADVRGSGYNAFQSTIAVGSGQLTGKGVGYGTQSRLKFLPEYQTDFIFAAFAEEWGFFGVLIFFFLFSMVIWRIITNALKGATNFEILFGLGLIVMFMSHLIIHVGMNIGILPVTGLPLPFLSYGGSHLLAEFMGLGILMGMRRYSLAFHRDDVKNEFIGPQ